MPMPRLALSRALLALSLAVDAGAQSPAAPIRIWGHGHPGQDYILTLLKAWQDGFSTTHPGVTFDDQLTGNASALGGLYTNTADLALLDRDASFIEVDSYQQGNGYDPFRIPIARGSISTAHHAPTLKLYINPANPLQHLTLAQLDGIFDADHRRGDKAYKTWGDLGLTGAWASAPIHLYTYEIQTAEMQFFERAALKGSQKFACCITFFNKDHAVGIPAAVTSDKYGMALVTAPAPKLKPVPLASTDDVAAVLPADPAYPLSRTVYLYANRKPKAPVPSNVAAFLAYIVSPEGQAVVAHTGGYLPLTSDQAKQAREALQ